MICVYCYIGQESAQVSREMVMELRERWKLPAYVFSKADEERRQEFERVKKIHEDYRRLCQEKNLPMDPNMHVRTRHIENEYAVLVGNFKDADTARKARDDIRKLPMPKVKLWQPEYVPEIPPPGSAKSAKVEEKKKIAEPANGNPFQGAFVVHNPTIKQERPADWDKQGMAGLKNLNAAENYSLLNCKKPYTLVVKQFLLPAETRSASGTIFGKMNPFVHKSDIDVPGQNAHNMAELLHKTTHLDAFVLHTKFASMVTVGAFDSLDDPSLRATQEMLRNQYKIPLPVPMAVPH